MSKALYELESLRFYEEHEIELSEMMVQKFSNTVRRTLSKVNPTLKVFRVVEILGSLP